MRHTLVFHDEQVDGGKGVPEIIIQTEDQSAPESKEQSCPQGVHTGVDVQYRVEENAHQPGKIISTGKQSCLVDAIDIAGASVDEEGYQQPFYDIDETKWCQLHQCVKGGAPMTDRFQNCKKYRFWCTLFFDIFCLAVPFCAHQQFAKKDVQKQIRSCFYKCFQMSAGPAKSLTERNL